MKRKTALAKIMVEFAENGKPTKEALWAMLEGRVSLKVYNEQARKGIKIFNGVGRSPHLVGQVTTLITL